MQKRQHPLATWREAQTPRITQGQFAGLVKVDRWTINSIETGRRQPSVDLAGRIEEVTGRTVTRSILRPDIYAGAA